MALTVPRERSRRQMPVFHKQFIFLPKQVRNSYPIAHIEVDRRGVVRRVSETGQRATAVHWGIRTLVLLLVQ